MQLACDVGPVPMQVGAVLVLGGAGPFTVAGARRVVAGRIGRVPRLRQRLVDAPPGCGRPVWVTDPGFDIHQHVRAVPCPAPGDDRALLDLVSRLVTEPLPRSRPLWRATFVTGLEGGDAALVLVFHHVLTDGLGGLAVLASLVDGLDPAREDPGPRGRASEAAVPSWPRLALDAWGERLRAVTGARAGLRRFRDGLAELGAPRTGLIPRTSLNRPTGRRRHMAVVRADLDAVREAARRHDAGVNDVVLTAVTGALRRLLDARGERAGVLSVSVSVSGRPADDPLRPGNHVGSMAVLLPLDGDPGPRLRRVAAVTRGRKTRRPGSSAVVLGPMLRLLRAAGVLRWITDHQRLTNTFLTNMRGPAHRLALAGAPIREIIPLTATTGNVTVVFAVLSYAGVLAVTILADRDGCPDLPLLAAALRAELDALTAPLDRVTG